MDLVLGMYCELSSLPCVIFLDTNPVYNKRDLPALFLAHPSVQHFTHGACHSTAWLTVDL